MSQPVPADPGQGAGATGPVGGPGVLLVGGRALPPPGWHGWRDGRAAPQDWPTAVAVRGGRVVAVGSDAVAREAAGADAEVIDLAGRLVLPGFIDAHAHPLTGGWERQCADLTGITDRGRDAGGGGALRRATHPEEEWVRGGGWSMSAFPGGTPARGRPRRRGGGPAGVPAQPRPPLGLGEQRRAAAGRRRTPAPPTRPAGGSSATRTALRPARCTSRRWTWSTSWSRSRRRSSRTPRWRRRSATCTRSASPAGRTRSSGSTRGSATVCDTYLRAQADGRLRADVVAALWWPRGLSAADVHRQVASFVARRARADEAAAEVAAERRQAAGARPQRQDHAGRRGRVVHRLDARALPRHDTADGSPRPRGIAYLDPNCSTRRSPPARRPASACTCTRSATVPSPTRSPRSRPRGPPTAPPGLPHQIAHLQVVGERGRPALGRTRGDREHAGAVGLPRAADGRAHAALPRPAAGGAAVPVRRPARGRRPAGDGLGLAGLQRRIRWPPSTSP